MAVPVPFSQRLLAVVIPTKVQALGSMVLGLLIIVSGQFASVLSRLGITTADIMSVQTQFNERFGVILRSSVAGQFAVVVFWAIIGLVAYLICWGLYNVLVEARNEVTLTTEYTNRGHWRSPIYTLALKTVSAVLLMVAVATFWYGLALWWALLGQALILSTPVTWALAVLGVIGCAAQLYLLLVGFQLTFTPWYQEQAFTES